VLFLVYRFLSPWWRRRQVPPKRRFLQEPHGVTTQKTPFFLTMIAFIWSACVLFRCICIFDMFYIQWPVGQFGFMEYENKYLNIKWSPHDNGWHRFKHIMILIIFMKYNLCYGYIMYHSQAQKYASIEGEIGCYMTS
jgi:hypothetical protein